MNFLQKNALNTLKYYLTCVSGQTLVCFNQSVPKSVLRAAKVDNFYYYQKKLRKQVLKSIYIQGILNELPFTTDSVDCFILWHNFTLEDDLQLILKEMYRALAPEGQLICIGANHPCFFKDHQNIKNAVKRSKLTKVLLQTDFKVEKQITFGFRPQISNPIIYQSLKPLEVIGQFCWPLWGANFLIQARKTVFGANNGHTSTVKRKVHIPSPAVEPVS